VLIKEDEPFNQQRLEEGIEKLNESGLFEPIDKDVNVEFFKDSESPLLKIVIKVKEKLP
jgi:outer membrane protein assembly factor BamA